MISDVLQSISGVGAYPAFSLIMFIAAFALVLWKVLSMDKQDALRFSRLPLDKFDNFGATGRHTKKSERPGEE